MICCAACIRVPLSNSKNPHCSKRSCKCHFQPENRGGSTLTPLDPSKAPEISTRGQNTAYTEQAVKFKGGSIIHIGKSAPETEGHGSNTEHFTDPREDEA